MEINRIKKLWMATIGNLLFKWKVLWKIQRSFMKIKKNTPEN